MSEFAAGLLIGGFWSVFCLIRLSFIRGYVFRLRRAVDSMPQDERTKAIVADIKYLESL